MTQPTYTFSITQPNHYHYRPLIQPRVPLTYWVERGATDAHQLVALGGIEVTGTESKAAGTGSTEAGTGSTVAGTGSPVGSVEAGKGWKT